MSLFHSPRIVTDGLVLCLDAGNIKSYPGSGTTWTDLSGRRNNGTLTNGPTYNSANGGSIVFDGTNDYVNVPNNSNFSIRSSTSFEIWINIITVTTDRLPFGKGSEWWFSVGYTSLGGTSGQFNWLAYDGSGWNTLNTGVSVSANSWYHLVTTWDGTVFRFYSNGSLAATSSNLSAKTWTNTSNTLDIGGFGSGLQQMTNQKVSIARIYQGKTLTAAEISQNFNALRGRFGI